MLWFKLTFFCNIDITSFQQRWNNTVNLDFIVKDAAEQ